MNTDANEPAAIEPRVIERKVVERRGAGLFRQFLLFVAGVLLGANGVYFWMQKTLAEQLREETARVATLPTAPPAAVPATVVNEPHAVPATAADPAANAMPAAPDPATAPQPAPYTGPQPQGLLIPVQGIKASQLLDTFNDARGQNRVHDAIDIMATAGTPVVAAADGTIVKLFNSDAGGITLYQFDPGRQFVYYYAHLQGYAPGIAEQQAVKKGQLIGYVGSTGNASPDAPHLHFAVGVLGPEKKWHESTALNPYPLLGGAPK